MALRLENAGLATAESWLRSQAAYDLWQAKHTGRDLKVRILTEAA
jgi:plasmid maintenance system antidote protein VapI